MMNDLTEFLRARASEDLASGDDDRRARGQIVLMFTGWTANTPESFRNELRWLAGLYSGHPEWRALNVGPQLPA
jgi:hypothetical protein